MSISSKFIMGALPLASSLGPKLSSLEQILAHARRHNAKQTFKVPKDARHDYGVRYVKVDSGDYPLLTIKKKGPSKTVPSSMYVEGVWFMTFAKCKFP